MPNYAGGCGGFRCVSRPGIDSRVNIERSIQDSLGRRGKHDRGPWWIFPLVLLLVVTAVPIVQSAGVGRTHTWTPTGALLTGRGDHTATLLTNGQVLVAGGGFGGPGKETPYASAELYDTRTGRWRATGAMHAFRVEHTATLLPSGMVLVAGGLNLLLVPVSPHAPAAELYNPRTGRWTPTAPMRVGRSAHTATLLPSGMVLVAGGLDAQHHALSSAELFDPRSGVWSSTAPMHGARFGHSATLLPSGKVLVTGGALGSKVLSSAELYDPRTGSWKVSGPLHQARLDHTAVLLSDGTVLVAGGVGPAPTIQSPLTLTSAERYDPHTGMWSAAGHMHVPRVSHTATLLPSGDVLVTGGQDDHSITLSSAELYDPRANRWTPAAAMHTARYGHTATLLRDGAVLVAGACCAAPDPQSGAELFR
jgi:Galactose oxidase, central domain/Kelch motif